MKIDITQKIALESKIEHSINNLLYYIYIKKPFRKHHPSTHTSENPQLIEPELSVHTNRRRSFETNLSEILDRFIKHSSRRRGPFYGPAIPLALTPPSTDQRRFPIRNNGVFHRRSPARVRGWGFPGKSGAFYAVWFSHL